MLQLPLLLLRLVASQTSKSATDSPTNTITHAFSKIAQLTLRLLAFALGILLLAGLAHPLEPESASEGLFAGADGLVPRAGGAVGVVLRDALCADGEGADVAAGVGDVFAGFGFGFLLFGLVLGLVLLVDVRWCVRSVDRSYLVRLAAGERAESRLGRAGGLVEGVSFDQVL
jgi:hypothetical protein